MSNYLVYDDDCSICRSFKKFVSYLDAYNNIRFLPLREAEKIGLLDEIPELLRYSSFHLISSKGKESGSDAIPTLIGLLPAGKLVSFIIKRSFLLNRITDTLYKTFSRLHYSDRCKAKLPN